MKHDNISFINLIINMNGYLRRNSFTQIPQVSSNSKITKNSYYRKNNNLLVIHTPTQKPKPSKRRFKNRREFLKYIRYLRYMYYMKRRGRRRR